VQWELAKQGIGICIVMDEVGDTEPRVRRVLPDLPPIPVPVWLATHRELHTSRRIRVVFDLLADELGRSAKGPYPDQPLHGARTRRHRRD
jgi:DNA-binding transcriptional LysR family regulator